MSVCVNVCALCAVPARGRDGGGERVCVCVCKMDTMHIYKLGELKVRGLGSSRCRCEEQLLVCVIKLTLPACLCQRGLKGNEGFDLEKASSTGEEQSSLHCSTVFEESEEKRACMAHRAERPIRLLRVALKPIGSVQLRLKIDNCRREQQGEKAFWETWTHLIPHPPTTSIISKR